MNNQKLSEMVAKLEQERDYWQGCHSTDTRDLEAHLADANRKIKELEKELNSFEPTDLTPMFAEAEKKGARGALTRLSDEARLDLRPHIAQYIREFRDREYPASEESEVKQVELPATELPQDVSAAVERVRGKISAEGKAWLPCDLTGEHIQSVSEDLRTLVTFIQLLKYSSRKVTKGEICAHCGKERHCNPTQSEPLRFVIMSGGVSGVMYVRLTAEDCRKIVEMGGNK